MSSTHKWSLQHRQAPAAFLARPRSMTEVINSGAAIGLDVLMEPQYAWVAEERLATPLPENWAAYFDTDGRLYYYNIETGESRWEMPLDEELADFLNQLREADAKAQAAEQERQMAAKEAAQRRQALRAKLRASKGLPPQPKLTEAQIRAKRDARRAANRGAWKRAARGVGMLRTVFKAKDEAAEGAQSADDDEDSIFTPPFNLAKLQALAHYFGIDLVKERGLLWYVGWFLDQVQGAPLPDGWKHEDGVYFNETTGVRRYSSSCNRSCSAQDASAVHPASTQVVTAVENARARPCNGVASDQWWAVPDAARTGIMYVNICNGKQRATIPTLGVDAAVMIQKTVRRRQAQSSLARMRKLEQEKTPAQRLLEAERREARVAERKEQQRARGETHAMMKAEKEQRSKGDKFWGIEAVLQSHIDEWRARAYRLRLEALAEQERRQEEERLAQLAAELERAEKIRLIADQASELRNTTQMTSAEVEQVAHGDKFWGIDAARARIVARQRRERLRMHDADRESQQLRVLIRQESWQEKARQEAVMVREAERIRRQNAREQYMHAFWTAPVSAAVMEYQWPAEAVPEPIPAPIIAAVPSWTARGSSNVNSSSSSLMGTPVEEMGPPIVPSRSCNVFHMMNTIRTGGRRGHFAMEISNVSNYRLPTGRMRIEDDPVETFTDATPKPSSRPPTASSQRRPKSAKPGSRPSSAAPTRPHSPALDATFGSFPHAERPGSEQPWVTEAEPRQFEDATHQLARLTMREPAVQVVPVSSTKPERSKSFSATYALCERPVDASKAPRPATANARSPTSKRPSSAAAGRKPAVSALRRPSSTIDLIRQRAKPRVDTNNHRPVTAPVTCTPAGGRPRSASTGRLHSANSAPQCSPSRAGLASSVSAAALSKHQPPSAFYDSAKRFHMHSHMHLINASEDQLWPVPAKRSLSECTYFDSALVMLPGQALRRCHVVIWRTSLLYCFNTVDDARAFLRGTNKAAAYLDLETVLSVTAAPELSADSIGMDCGSAPDANLPVPAGLMEALEDQGLSLDWRSELAPNSLLGVCLRSVTHSWTVYPDWSTRWTSTSKQLLAFEAELAKSYNKRQALQAEHEALSQQIAAMKRRGVREGDSHVRSRFMAVQYDLEIVQKQLRKTADAFEFMTQALPLVASAVCESVMTPIARAVQLRMSALSELTEDEGLAEVADRERVSLLPGTLDLIWALHQLKVKSWTVSGPQLESLEQLWKLAAEKAASRVKDDQEAHGLLTEAAAPPLRATVSDGPMYRGAVLFVSDDEQFGYIRPLDSDMDDHVYFTMNTCNAPVHIGQRVLFAAVPDDRTELRQARADLRATLVTPLQVAPFATADDFETEFIQMTEMNPPIIVATFEE